MSERISRPRLVALDAELSGRDRAVVQAVAAARLMTGGQIQALFFPLSDHATFLTAARCARRVLHRLSEQRLLFRLQRRIGGVRAGSSAHIYGLGPVGQRLLQPAVGRLRYREPTVLFVDHTIAVAQLAVDLITHARAGNCELLQLQHEPACWRSFGGVAGRQLLRPDLYAALAVRDYEYRWFVEIDRGSESLPVVLRKCRSYEAYYRSGHEQTQHGVFPRVVWITSEEARRRRIATALATDRQLSAGLFLTATTQTTLAVLTGGPA